MPHQNPITITDFLILLFIFFILFLCLIITGKSNKKKPSAPSVSKRLPRDVFPDEFFANWSYENMPSRFQPFHPEYHSSRPGRNNDIENGQYNYSNGNLIPDRQRHFSNAQQLNDSEINRKHRSNPVDFLPQNKNTKQQIFECTICMLDGSEREVIFEPCAHVVACLKCAMKITRCPMCQSEIVTMKKVYLS